MAEKAPKKLHSFRIALAVLLMLAALFALLFADSANRLVTTDYTVTSARLPADFDGFRIVQLSDLHAAEFGKDNARLVRAVAAAQPDLIVLTGDFIEAEDQIPVTLALARQLVPLAPVYFVSGNHDWASHAISALFDGLADAGVTCLRNEFVTLQRGAGSIVLAGVDDPNGLADMLKPDEVAAAVQNQFPDTELSLLTSAVQRYQEIGAYCETPILTQDSFDRLQTVMQSAGELTQTAPYDQIVNNSYAEAAVAG